MIDALVGNASDVDRIVGERFNAYKLLRTAHGAASVSVFENESGADQSHRAAAAWIRETSQRLRGSAHVSAEEVVITV